MIFGSMLHCKICIPKRVLCQRIKPGASAPLDLQRARAQSRKRDISTEPTIMVPAKIALQALTTMDGLSRAN
jgi:hypothetical protein